MRLVGLYASGGFIKFRPALLRIYLHSALLTHHKARRHATSRHNKVKRTTTMRFELTRAKPSRFLIYRLNHSATLSDVLEVNVSKEDSSHISLLLGCERSRVRFPNQPVSSLFLYDLLCVFVICVCCCVCVCFCVCVCLMYHLQTIYIHTTQYQCSGTEHYLFVGVLRLGREDS